MKKLKQIVTALVSVILAGTVTVNASAAESIETPYRSPILSSFPSNASLEDLEKATDNEDLELSHLLLGALITKRALQRL